MIKPAEQKLAPIMKNHLCDHMSCFRMDEVLITQEKRKAGKIKRNVSKTVMLSKTGAIRLDALKSGRSLGGLLFEPHS